MDFVVILTHSQHMIVGHRNMLHTLQMSCLIVFTNTVTKINVLMYDSCNDILLIWLTGNAHNV